MAKVSMVDNRTTYNQIYSIGVNEYFTYEGKLYCKLTSCHDSNVFSVRTGRVITLDRHLNVLPVKAFEITIKE